MITTESRRKSSERPSSCTPRDRIGSRSIERSSDCGASSATSFPTREALAAFEQTEAYQEILHMLTKLREQGPTGGRRRRSPPG